MATPAQNYKRQTNHHDPHWPALSSKLLVQQDPRYTVFTPSKISTTSLVLAIYTFVVETCLETIKGNAKDAIEASLSDVSSDSTISFDHRDAIELCYQHFEENPHEKNRILVTKKGVHEPKYYKCLERAKEILANSPFVKGGYPEFPYTWTEKHFDDWRLQIRKELLIEAYAS
jgi:hypothetical protein